MDKNSIVKILILMSVLILLACNNSSSSSSGGGAVVGAPKLRDVDPAVNRSSVNVGKSITATFDKAMNGGSAGSFVVHGYQTGKMTGISAGHFTGLISMHYKRPVK